MPSLFPDEASAMASANVWLGGHPATGRPYEVWGGAAEAAAVDTSGYVIGGVAGQAQGWQTARYVRWALTALTAKTALPALAPAASCTSVGSLAASSGDKCQHYSWERGELGL